MRRDGWIMVAWGAGVFLFAAIYLRSLVGCLLSVDIMLMGAAFVFSPARQRLSIVCAVLVVALTTVAAVMVLRTRGIV